MHSLKSNLICLLTICSLVTTQTSEHRSSNKAIITRPIQSPANALIELASIIDEHETTPYTEKELREVNDLIRLYKDHINTHIAISAVGHNKNNLALAIEHRQLAIVKLLLRHGAQVTSIAVHSFEEKNALQVCPTDDIEIFTTLLSADKQATHTINTPDGYGDTMLHDLLRKASVFPMEIITKKVCWLMHYGAKPELPNDDDETAFDIAEDESFLSEEADRQDMLGILGQDPLLSLSYRQFLREHVLGINGNIASHVRNRQITGPWADAQRLARLRK